MRSIKLSPKWALVLLVALLFGASVLPDAAFARRPIKKMKVQVELREELNAVLKATSALQEASFKRDEQKTALATKALMKRLKMAARKAHLAKEQRPHILKILNAAESYLDRSRKSAGRDRQTYFQRAFSQLVLIAQIYQLDSYKIFFCPKDKSIWLQRGSKPQNPVNPETYGTCGKLVT